MEVPDVAVTLDDGQAQGFLAPVRGEQAQFDPFGMGGKDSEIDPVAGQAGTHRPGAARADRVAQKPDRGGNGLRRHAVRPSYSRA